MHQKRLRPGSTLSDISASSFNLVFQNAQLQLSRGGRKASINASYVLAQGRNLCGYTVEPGTPVLLGTWYPEGTNFGAGSMGWLDVHPCYFPSTQAEATTLIGSNRNLFSVGVCIGDAVANNAVGQFAISGVVEIKVGAGSGFVGPQPRSAAYQSTGKMFDTFGFARKLYDVGGGYAMCDLSAQSNVLSYSLTQARQAPPTPTTATVAGISSFVLDSAQCAGWQVNGDQGLAMWVGGAFQITTPWCVDA